MPILSSITSSVVVNLGCLWEKHKNDKKALVELTTCPACQPLLVKGFEIS